jgi:hypothetical protein
MVKSLTIPFEPIDLMGLLPPYFQEVKDYIELMRTEQIELEKLKQNITRVYSNLFVQTCDESTLHDHEQWLGIFAQPDDTLEIRRIRVLSRYNTVLPITLPSLRVMLNNLLGAGNWEVEVDYPNYIFSIKFTGAATSLTYEAENMLIQMLPAHLDIAFIIERKYEASNYQFGLMESQVKRIYTDSRPLPSDVEIYLGSVVTKNIKGVYTDGL